ncbi:MAG: hypothetical protein NT087_11555 [Deltaproteobacteria bacterium]|nr:hypothetical protein [Deltaproteobacteria bacterium]
MINLIEKSNSVIGLDEFGADIPLAPQEIFVLGVYASLDEAIACELDRLRREEGIVPSCKPGCCHCCRYHILTNSAEAHTLAQYIRREFSADQIRGLRLRTQQWHEWDDSKPGRHPSSSIDELADLSCYDHSCPLDVNGVCGAYPVRPVVCRTHFVSSPPQSCQVANDPESSEDAPLMLRSVVAAASPFATALQDHIESSGLDFSRSRMLLPQWLAIEMGWDFTISR